MNAESTIFLVDDEHYCLNLYSQHITGLGFDSIKVFSCGKDLLSNLDLKPDLIFLDYNLDDIKGLELLVKIKSELPDATVVILSGQQHMEITVKLMNNGAFDYIIKDEWAAERITDVMRKFQASSEFINKANAIENRPNEKRFINMIAEAQEKIRKEISGELHDNINQLLGASKLYLDTAKSDVHNREELITASKNILNSAISEIRKLSHGLCIAQHAPLAFGQSVSNILSLLCNQTRMVIEEDLKISLIESNLNSEQKFHLVRILQELINNSIKYSGASKISLKSDFFGGKLKLTFSDNGKGFSKEPANPGIGIKNVKSRVEKMKGSYSLITMPGKGCAWKIYIPVQAA